MAAITVTVEKAEAFHSLAHAIFTKVQGRTQGEGPGARALPLRIS